MDRGAVCGLDVVGPKYTHLDESGASTARLGEETDRWSS
jgi:hypothetical protein